MQKNILILGAGLMQKPAILSAKELGCKVFVVDGNPEAVCVPLADEFEAIDLKDKDALLKYAEKINAEECGLSAVFTAGTDFSANVAYIAEKFHLCGHSYEAALNASDKVRMRRCFAKCGVNSPRFIEITEEMLSQIQSDAALFLKNNGFSSDAFPYVVKPCDNMGGRGCRMIRNADELYENVKNSIQFSRTKRAIFEEYMDGREFSIDSLVLDGKVTITGFAERHIFYPPYFIEMGHTMSAVLSESDYNKLKTEFEKAVHALGLTCGVAKADIKLTSKGAMIGEIAARLSGGYMSGWTFPYASDINLTKQALMIALGMKPEIPVDGTPVVPAKTCAERAWLSIPGVISKIYGYEKVREFSEIKDILPRTYENSRVNFPLNNVEKCGNLISLSPDRDKAISINEKAISLIVVRLKANNAETTEFLESSLSSVFPPSAFCVTDDEISSLDAYYKNHPFTLEWNELPSVITSHENEHDWNFRTIKQTIELFEEIIENSDKSGCAKKIANPVKFWRYLFRGGIQGALYYYDCLD